MTDTTIVPAVFVLMPEDNVAIACRQIAAGETVAVPGGTLTATTFVPLAHKIALRAFRAGDKVVRCGVPIGSATQAIAPGEHVHTQNLASDYIPTFTLDAGHTYREATR